MPGKSTHIVFLCSRLDLPGGIERAVVNTANLFCSKGLAVTLLVADETMKSFYHIHPTVQLIQHPLSFGITPEGNIITRKIKLLSDVLKMRRLLKQLRPTLVIATEYPFAAAAILSGARKRSKVISWEHHHFYELKRNTFWEKMFRFSYSRLNAVVCPNSDEKILYGTVNKNTITIPYYILPSSAKAPLINKTILTIARITHVKGIDLLIKAALIVFKNHPDWKWKIIGDSGANDIIEQVIREKGIAQNLILQPPVDHNILPEYLNASLYVTTSRNECLPMTLLEAQSAGLPCIAFDCETGPRHIIIHNETGLLVEKENTVKLAEAICSLINNEGQRIKMGEKAVVNIQRFSPEKVYELWDSLL